MRTIEREVVGAFIFSSDNRVLLGHSGVFNGDWSVPGGGVDEDQDDTHRDALNREILEEVGIDISGLDAELLDGKNSGTSEKTLRETRERVIVKMNFHDYIVRLGVVSSEVELIMEDDFTGAQWFAADELKTLKMTPGTEKRLKQIGFIAA